MNGELQSRWGREGLSITWRLLNEIQGDLTSAIAGLQNHNLDLLTIKKQFNVFGKYSNTGQQTKSGTTGISITDLQYSVYINLNNLAN